MLGLPGPRIGLGLFFLILALIAAYPQPQRQDSRSKLLEPGLSQPLLRVNVLDPSAQFLDTSKQCRYQLSPVPEELDTMELPNGLVDDYGILPKHPGRRIVHSFLPKIQKRKRKRKRDGPDLSEYYFEAPQ